MPKADVAEVPFALPFQRNVDIEFVDTRRWSATPMTRALIGYYGYLHWPSRCMWIVPGTENEDASTKL